jgi:hypothetical protein
MSVTLAYLCGDDVNRSLAARWLAALGAKMTEDPTAASAVMVDADHPPFGRELSDVLEDLPACPATVHGQNLSAAMRRSLRARGMRVCRRLTRRTVQKLYQEVTEIALVRGR